MCGITAYCGNGEALPFLMQGLAKLEYRGYDSAGVTVLNNVLTTVKCKGRLKNLEEKLKDHDMTGHVGIGHTRWATHGVPSNLNSHPHTNPSNTISIVHNGIIENYRELKDILLEKGYSFQSETDSEVVVMCLDYFYEGDLLEAVKKTLNCIDGSYALCIVSTEHPDEVVVAKKASPLVIGRTEDASVAASDIPALLAYTKDVYFLDDLEMAVLKKDSITFYNKDGKEITKEMTTIPYDMEAAQKNGFDTYMLKEINEQPHVIQETLRGRIFEHSIVLDELKDVDFNKFNKVYYVACGTAYHAGLCGASILERATRLPVLTQVASEFRYNDPIIDEKTLCIFVSQSGETADSLAALRLANERGAKTISIVNVKGSSIARESDYVLYTHAGPEIAVASTKAFSVQCAGMYLIALKLAEVNNLMTNEQMKDFCDKFEQAIGTVEEVLKMDDYIKGISEKIQDTFSAFYLGRGLDYGIACEACLKLKEISYVNAEAYCAGELKHGTISLITEGVPVIAIATQENVLPKLMANVEEVKARGAHVIVVTDKDMSNYEGIYDDLIQVPATDDLFATFASTVALQLLAYHVTVFRGYDVDQPRNLAKSVTVE